MTIPPGIHEAIQRLVAILDRLGLEYAVGGAVAMAFSGYLRGTRDLDILVVVPALRSQEFAAALDEAGFRMRDADLPVAVDAARMVQEWRSAGLTRLWWQDTKVEIFSPRIALQNSILRRKLRVDLGGLALWITTAEDLVLLKMIFHRPKDLEDIRRMLLVNRESLERSYLLDWAARTLESAPAAELREMLERLDRMS